MEYYFVPLVDRLIALRASAAINQVELLSAPTCNKHFSAEVKSLINLLTQLTLGGDTPAYSTSCSSLFGKGGSYGTTVS